MAKDEGKIAGVLPLVWLNSKVFGNLLCSLPFFSEAGLVADAPAAGESLLKESIRIAQEGNAEYIELRHRKKHRFPGRQKQTRSLWSVMSFPMPRKICSHLSTKMRTNVRRSLKLDLEAEFGKQELLEGLLWSFLPEDARTWHACIQPKILRGDS